MDYTCRTKTLQSILKSIQKGTIVLTHKLQRPEGQWNKKQKTDLIDSIIRKYIINPTYAVKEDGVLSVIDGVQRLSCVRDFISDKFTLDKNMDSIYINDEEINIGGLKFSKLDDDIKDLILNSELQIYEMTDCTEKDIRETFRRQNAGKPLNSKQLRVIYGSDDFNKAINTLVDHPFMKKLLTTTQHKNSTDKDLIIQTLMLICTNQERDFTSFRKNDMDDFVDNFGDESLEKIDVLRDALDSFDEVYENIKIPITSISIILYSGYRVKKDKKSFHKLIDLINDFLDSYENNEQYKQFVNSGTSNKENVRGRFDWWREKIKTI